MDDLETHLDAILAKGAPFSGRTRDPERIDRILGLLREIWLEQPDTRLLQMLVAVAPQGPGPVPHLFYLEDDRLEALLRRRFRPAPSEDEPAGPRP